jgi:hypothetical protein
VCLDVSKLFICWSRTFNNTIRVIREHITYKHIQIQIFICVSAYTYVYTCLARLSLPYLNLFVSEFRIKVLCYSDRDRWIQKKWFLSGWRERPRIETEKRAKNPILCQSHGPDGDNKTLLSVERDSYSIINRPWARGETTENIYWYKL